MGLLDALGLSPGQQIAAPIDAIGNALGKIVTTDKDRLAAEQALELLRQQPGILQNELNKIDAANGSNFRGGYRPMLAWICDLCIALYFIPMFLIADYFWAVQCMKLQAVAPFPISPDQVLNLVYLVLGNAGIKTIENKIMN